MRDVVAHRAAAACVFILSLLAAPPRAEAQEGQAPRDDEARVLYQAAVIAYDGGHYAEALEHFQRSYALSGRGPLLYNIATTAERTRQDALALESYEAYLEAVPDSAVRARVETRIGELRARLAAQEARRVEEAEAEQARLAEERALEAPSPAADGATDRPPARGGLGPALTLGAGAAVTVVGAVLLGVGLADRAAVESPSAGEDHWRDDLAHRYERGPALMGTGFVALPIGLAAVAAGTVWQVKRSRAGDDAHAELRLGLGSASLLGRF